MATKARTARKKAVKPTRMWAIVTNENIVYRPDYISSSESEAVASAHFCNRQKIGNLKRGDVWKAISVTVTPAHKGKP